MGLSVADDLSHGCSIAGAGSLAFLHISFESRTDDCNIHGGGYRATLMTPPCRRRIAPRGQRRLPFRGVHFPTLAITARAFVGARGQRYANNRHLEAELAA